ncbi:MAG: Trk system potassium transporter TrkA [Oscillospiraceae bacterium]|nr:Trk system potassium transporter TrkA [Oscillospiraceae bacterium]
MNIIIVGCGKVGTTLASRLDEEGNNVTVIDIDGSRISTLVDSSDIMGVVGNGAVHKVQVEAGIREADLLIAVTGSDELNLLCCLIAKKSASCRTIARVRDPAYNDEASFLQSGLGLAMTINPELTAAREISRILQFPSALKIDTFAGGRVELIKFKMPEPCKLVGMKVMDVVASLRCDVLVCIIENGDDVVIPNGSYVFRQGDVISLIATHQNVQEFFKKIGYKNNAVKDVIIAGGGDICYYLTESLRKSTSVTIIERDMERCQKLSEAFPNVRVINADATAKDALLENGIGNVGGVVALTNMDEENVLLSLYAIEASKGKSKVITKVNRLDFDEVIKRLSLDTIVYPKNLTTDQIIRYVRGMKDTIGSNVETLYNVIRDRIEAAEFRIDEKSPITGIPISDLRFKNQTLLAAIFRKNKAFIPRGSDRIEPGDSVVVVSDIKMLSDISDILAG